MGKMRMMKATGIALGLGVSMFVFAGCGSKAAYVSDAESENKMKETETTGTESEMKSERNETGGQENEVRETKVIETEDQATEEIVSEVRFKTLRSKAEEPLMPQAGVRSIANLLATARAPIGTTMYVWGGGWNENDTRAGIEAVSIGISSRWAEFYEEQDSAYDYRQTRYQIHDGLDCSGYIGWTIYNVLETIERQRGYVMKAAEMAETFAGYGWGSYTPAAQVTEWKPGDIMSMKGHVWLSLGMCKDGSVVLMHASPPGVRICGTKLADGNAGEAVKLAEDYMKNNYPAWYQRYPECSVDFYYLQNSSQMRWNPETLTDNLKIQDMNAEQVLELLYPE